MPLATGTTNRGHNTGLLSVQARTPPTCEHARPSSAARLSTCLYDARAAYSAHARCPVRTQCASASQPVGQVMPCRHPHVTYDCGHVRPHETSHAHTPGIWRAAVAQAEKDQLAPLAAGESARSSTAKRAGLHVQARRTRSRGREQMQRSKGAREVGASDRTR